MKIMATFDGSKASEAIIPTLVKMAALPESEFTLISVGDVPSERVMSGGTRKAYAGGSIMGTAVEYVIAGGEPQFAETKGQAIDRRLAEIDDALLPIAKQLPEGAHVHLEAHLSSDAAAVIIDRARAEEPDVIVMATRGRGGVSRALFGSTTDRVVRSGVAPVLLVHPPH